MVPIEPVNHAEGHQEEFGNEGGDDEGMDYDETQDLPDEEYDLGECLVIYCPVSY